MHMKSIDNFFEQLVSVNEQMKENYFDEFFTDLAQYKISRDYFNKIDASSSFLLTFFEDSLRPLDLQAKINQHLGINQDNTLKLYILIDVIRCFNGLDHPSNFSDPEGIALLLLLNKCYGVRELRRLEDIEEVDSATMSLWSLLPYINECSHEIGKCDQLLTSQFIEEIDEKTDYQYRKLLYKFCKDIAEVDSVIDKSEQEWLEEIARLSDADPSNDIDISDL